MELLSLLIAIFIALVVVAFGGLDVLALLLSGILLILIILIIFAGILLLSPIIAICFILLFIFQIILQITGKITK